MRDLIDIVSEWVVVGNVEFKMPDFTTGQQVGRAATGIGQLQIWKLEADNEVAYGAIIPEEGATNPVGFLGLRGAGNGIAFAKNAMTREGDEYRGKGILSELFYFANHIDKLHILSDTQMTESGVQLWHSLLKSQKFHAKLFYSPTKEVFDLSEIGQGTASDGEPLIAPEGDKGGITQPDRPEGQRFFYLLEYRETKHDAFPLLKEDSGHRMGILQPLPKFPEGAW